MLEWNASLEEAPTGGNAMPIYVTLLHFTEKGLHDVKDTVKRSEAFRSHVP